MRIARNGGHLVRACVKRWHRSRKRDLLAAPSAVFAAETAAPQHSGKTRWDDASSGPILLRRFRRVRRKAAQPRSHVLRSSIGCLLVPLG